MVEDSLIYSISERDFDRKVAPYLKKLSNSTKSVVSEFYNISNKVIIRERKVVYRLYDNTNVNVILNKAKNMTLLLSKGRINHEKLINKLERLAKK
jgi:hypothetical protein